MPSGKTAILILTASAAAMAAVGAVSAPSHTESVQQALDALARNDLPLAERLGVGVVRSGPSAGRAWLIVAEARHRAGRFTQAIDAYRQFQGACQSRSERAYAAERIQRCRREAAGVRPVPISEQLTAEQRARFLVVDSRHREHNESTEHFIVRAYNTHLAKLVGRQAEVSLERICRTILSGQDYPHTVEINVWPTIKEYRKHATSAPEWSGGSFVLRREEDGRIVRRIDLTQLDEKGLFDVEMLDRVLPHEMCHLVLAELFGEAVCPLALDEGLAMLAEASADNSRIVLAGSALTGEGKIPLARLLLMERCAKDEAAVFYAEAFSFADYLQSRMTRRQFGEMLDHVKAGRPLDEAIQRALYVPCDEAFLGKLARAWEAEAIKQSQFLRALDEAPTNGS